MQKVTFLFLLTMSIAIINIGCGAKNITGPETTVTGIKLADALTKLANIKADSALADITATSTALAKLTKADGTLDKKALGQKSEEDLKTELKLYGDDGDKAISKLISTLDTQIGATPAPTNKDELEAKKAALTTLKAEVNKILKLLPLTLAEALTKIVSITATSNAADITAITDALKKITTLDNLKKSAKIELKDTLVPFADDDGEKAISEWISTLKSQIDATPAPTNKDELEAKKTELEALKGEVDRIIAIDLLTDDEKAELKAILDKIIADTALTGDEKDKLINAVSTGSLASLAGIEDAKLNEVLNRTNNKINELSLAEMQTLLESLVENALKIRGIDSMPSTKVALGELKEHLQNIIAMYENLDKIKAGNLSTAKGALKTLVAADSIPGNADSINTDLKTIRKTVVDTLGEGQKNALKELARLLLSEKKWISDDLKATLEEIRDNGWVKKELTDALKKQLEELEKLTEDKATATIIVPINAELAKVTDVSDLTDAAKNRLETVLTPFGAGGAKEISKWALNIHAAIRTAVAALKGHVDRILGEAKKGILNTDERRHLDILEAYTRDTFYTASYDEITSIFIAISAITPEEIDNLKETQKERLREVLIWYSKIQLDDRSDPRRGIRGEALRILQPIKIEALEKEIGKLEKLTETTPTSDITAITKALKDIDINKDFVDRLDRNTTRAELREALEPYEDGGDKAISSMISKLTTQIDATPAPTNKDKLEAKKAALDALKDEVDEILRLLRHGF